MSKETAITNQICEMIIQDLQPVSIVEDSGFKALIAFAFPQNKIPCRKTINDRIENIML